MLKMLQVFMRKKQDLQNAAKTNFERFCLTVRKMLEVDCLMSFQHRRKAETSQKRQFWQRMFQKKRFFQYVMTENVGVIVIFDSERT